MATHCLALQTGAFIALTPLDCMCYCFDQLQLTRWKKRKLMLRDQITKLEDDMLPDIIA